MKEAINNTTATNSSPQTVVICRNVSNEDFEQPGFHIICDVNAEMYNTDLYDTNFIVLLVITFFVIVLVALALFYFISNTILKRKESAKSIAACTQCKKKPKVHLQIPTSAKFMALSEKAFSDENRRKYVTVNPDTMSNESSLSGSIPIIEEDAVPRFETLPMILSPPQNDPKIKSHFDK